VDAFARLEDVPAGYWPVIVSDDTGFDSAGVHCDRHGQPLALVTAGPDWSLTASHEVVEMLVDPFGRRLVAGWSPLAEQGRVEFLVEVADPVSDPALAYTVNGVRVSDFYTPRYFDPEPAVGVRYSFADHIRSPREVLRGGYLTWHDPVGGEWWQQAWFDGDAPTVSRLGRLEDVLCGLRSAVDAITARRRTGAVRPMAGGSPADRARPASGPQAARARRLGAEEAAKEVLAASRAKATAWRARCEQLIARARAADKREADGRADRARVENSTDERPESQ
jgi:hypothetical protein